MLLCCTSSIEQVEGADCLQNFDDCSDVGEAMREAFGSREDDPDIGVAATMIVVGGFVDRDMLVEVEVDAICSS